MRNNERKPAKEWSEVKRKCNRNLIKVNSFLQNIQVTENSKYSESRMSFNSSANNSSWSIEKNFSSLSHISNCQTPVINCKKPNILKKGPLLSRNLKRYTDPRIISAIKIQKFFRMYLVKEKIKLIKNYSFRENQLKLIGKGARVSNHIPFYVLVFQCKNYFLVKIRNLQTNTFFRIEIAPESCVFGFIKLHSPKLVFKSLSFLDNRPVFEYKKKSKNSTEINYSEYYTFKEYQKEISLLQASTRIKSIYLTLKLRKAFLSMKDRKVYHRKTIVKNKEYRVAVHLKKQHVLIEVYLLSKENGHWIYRSLIENKNIIQIYGEINYDSIMKDLRVQDDKIIIGSNNKMELEFPEQRHISYINSEMLLEDNVINKSFNGSFIIDTHYVSYRNLFLSTRYSVFTFECFSPAEPFNFRQISVNHLNASEALGIPFDWIHPIAYFLRTHCLAVTNKVISLNLTSRKIDIDRMAGKIQKYYRHFKAKRLLEARRNGKKKALKNLLSFIAK